MELIVSKSFIKEFYSNYDLIDTYCWEDFERFLRRQIADFDLITDFTWEELYSIALFEYPLLKELQEKARRIETVANVSELIQKKDFYSKGSMCKLFCVTVSSADCEQLEERFGYLYLCFENLKEKWKVFHSEREDYDLPVDGSKDSFQWQKLSDFRHPINQMIIFDKYLFTDRDEAPVTENLYKVLEYLLADKALYKPLQLLIITDVRNMGEEGEAIKSKFSNAAKGIEAHIKKHFKKLQVNVALINYNSRLHNAPSEHDREVYTNYFKFALPAGFDLFNEKNKPTKRTTFSAWFHFSKTGYRLSKSGIESLSGYYDSFKISKFAYQCYNVNLLQPAHFFQL